MGLLLLPVPEDLPMILAHRVLEVNGVGGVSSAVSMDLYQVSEMVRYRIGS